MNLSRTVCSHYLERESLIAAFNITEKLKDKYVVKNKPPPEGKDYNDYLKIFRSKPKTKNKEAVKK